MLNAIKTKTTALVAVAERSEAGAVIRAKGEAAEAAVRAAKLEAEIFTDQREKSTEAVVIALRLLQLPLK